MSPHSPRPLVGRIGVSPNAASFRLGAVRTHLAAAAFLVRAAQSADVPARLLVRIDDTNEERSRRHFEQPLIEELEQIARIPLHSLGNLNGKPWIIRQSERLPRYHEVASTLRNVGLAETLADGSTVIHVRGEQLMPTAGAVSESIRIMRTNGWPLWHFASAIDDFDTGVNLCVRGVDKCSAEPVQRAIVNALGGTPPSFYYLPKLIGDQGTDRVQDLLRTCLRRATLFEYIASSLLRKNFGCTSFEMLSSRVEVRSDRRSKILLDHKYLAKLDRQVSTRLDSTTLTDDLELHCRSLDDTITSDYLATHDVGALLTAYPRPLDVHYELVSAMAHERFSHVTPPIGVSATVSLLERSAQDAFEHLVRTGTRPTEAHCTLRWILCGLSTGPDFHSLWNWHRDQGTLDHRLAAARRTITELPGDVS
ncbi:hypothetical protein [Actinoalloteichus spitiensis]|uniref:hypothetical protein n=1 Tax=Actinoalloteichus spitiensis TaxID=252394 RepID=UPI0012F66AAC|nr:hypothetical protein [Actinoalloteichus spitiensis]